MRTEFPRPAIEDAFPVKMFTVTAWLVFTLCLYAQCRPEVQDSIDSMIIRTITAIIYLITSAIGCFTSRPAPLPQPTVNHQDAPLSMPSQEDSPIIARFRESLRSIKESSFQEAPRPTRRIVYTPLRDRARVLPTIPPKYNVIAPEMTPVRPSYQLKVLPQNIDHIGQTKTSQPEAFAPCGAVRDGSPENRVVVVPEMPLAGKSSQSVEQPPALDHGHLAVTTRPEEPSPGGPVLATIPTSAAAVATEMSLASPLAELEEPLKVTGKSDCELVSPPSIMKVEGNVLATMPMSTAANASETPPAGPLGELNEPPQVTRDSGGELASPPSSTKVEGDTLVTIPTSAAVVVIESPSAGPLTELNEPPQATEDPASEPGSQPSDMSFGGGVLRGRPSRAAVTVGVQRRFQKTSLVFGRLLLGGKLRSRRMWSKELARRAEPEVMKQARRLANVDLGVNGIVSVTMPFIFDVRPGMAQTGAAVSEKMRSICAEFGAHLRPSQERSVLHDADVSPSRSQVAGGDAEMPPAGQSAEDVEPALPVSGVDSMVVSQEQATGADASALSGVQAENLVSSEIPLAGEPVQPSVPMPNVANDADMVDSPEQTASDDGQVLSTMQPALAFGTGMAPQVSASNDTTMDEMTAQMDDLVASRPEPMDFGGDGFDFDAFLGGTGVQDGNLDVMDTTLDRVDSAQLGYDPAQPTPPQDQQKPEDFAARIDWSSVKDEDLDAAIKAEVLNASMAGQAFTSLPTDLPMDSLTFANMPLDGTANQDVSNNGQQQYPSPEFNPPPYYFSGAESSASTMVPPPGIGYDGTSISNNDYAESTTVDPHVLTIAQPQFSPLDPGPSWPGDAPATGHVFDGNYASSEQNVQSSTVDARDAVVNNNITKRGMDQVEIPIDPQLRDSVSAQPEQDGRRARPHKSNVADGNDEPRFDPRADNLNNIPNPHHDLVKSMNEAEDAPRANADIVNPPQDLAQRTKDAGIAPPTNADLAGPHGDPVKSKKNASDADAEASFDPSYDPDLANPLDDFATAFRISKQGNKLYPSAVINPLKNEDLSADEKVSRMNEWIEHSLDGVIRQLEIDTTLLHKGDKSEEFYYITRRVQYIRDLGEQPDKSWNVDFWDFSGMASREIYKNIEFMRDSLFQIGLTVKDSQSLSKDFWDAYSACEGFPSVSEGVPEW